MPAISCIVPVYNQAEYLADALDSVFGQTVAPTEVVVVDDGSTDAIDAALAPFLDRVRLIRQPNRGPASARNAGIRAATSEWLCFIDGDDLWPLAKLERQLAAFGADPGLDYCLTFTRHFWQPSVAAREVELRAQDHPITRDAPGYVFQTLLVRASTFARVGPIDETLRTGEDTDWIARAVSMGLRRRILEDVRVLRRMHERNLSYTCTSPAGLDDRKRLMFEHIARRKGGVR
jgi:glycosyltransferase involved in cell wall biosynthesis